jgi:hypothetical protein
MPRSPAAEAKGPGPFVAGDLAGRMTARDTVERTWI